MNINLLFLILFSLKCAYSARILATIFTPAYSHQVSFRPLWKELSNNGHEITLLTTDPMNDSELKNIKEINLSQSYEIMELYNASKILSGGKSAEKNYLQLFMEYMSALSKTSEWQLEHPEVRNIIQNKSEHFDLIIVELMIPTQLAFADRFNAPFIGVTSLDALPRTHRFIGNFIHPSIYPDWLLPFRKNLTFVQRLVSLIWSWFLWSFEYFVQFPTENQIVRKHFGDNIRRLEDIEKDLSMLFINVNPLYHNIRPLGPNTIQIGGGTHIKEVQPLPKDLKDYLDDATEGVIYFSLGTNVKSSLIRDQLRSVILKTFAELPYKVLWKFEIENLEDKPKNVKIIKWAPQQDLFRHPNVVLFITQCGLQSMEEAIVSHVPIVGMPFFGDQLSNAKIIDDKKMGLTVSPKNLSVEVFRDVILEVISNPMYRIEAKEISEKIKDVELTGLEMAVWWTEYTLRTHGARHLKNPVVDMPFWKFYLLDVIVFVFTISFIFLFVTVKIVKFFLRITFKKCFNVKAKKE